MQEIDQELLTATRIFLDERCEHSKDGEDSIQLLKDFIDANMTNNPVVQLRSICLACVEASAYTNDEWLRYKMFNFTSKHQSNYKYSKLEYRYRKEFLSILEAVAFSKWKLM